MRRQLSMSLVALSFAAACGAPPTETTDPGGYEIPATKDDSITPTGTDRLGKLTVTHPDPGSSGLAAYTPSAYLVGTNIVYATPNNTRVVEGQRQVGLYLHNGPPYELASFDIKKSTTTTIALAGLHLDNLIDYYTTVGARAYWSTSRPSLLQDLGYAATPGRYLELFAQPFTLTLSADKKLASFDIAVEANKVTSQDLAMPDPRVGMDVIAPERMQPDAMAKRFLTPMWATRDKLIASQGVNAGTTLTGKDAVALVDDAYHIALGTDRTEQHLYLYLNGSWTEVVGQSNTIITLPIRRLDINDVEVTNEDGDTQIVRGQYRVEWKMPTAAGGTWIAIADGKTFATNTGLDLVPGEYRVTVTYPRQEEPTPASDVYAIELK